MRRQKRLTIKEFSDRLGVSTATVSRAFNTKGRISSKTRNFILTKASELGYRANANARNLILQQSDSVGFFYPSLIEGEPDYFIAEIMLGVNEALTALGMRLHIYPFAPAGTGLPAELTALICDGSLGGIIIIGGTENASKLADYAEKADIPYITVADINTRKAGTVGFNTSAGAEKAGIYFRHSGRANPAFIRGIQDEGKLRGLKKGLGPLADKLIIDSGGTTFHDGYCAFRRITATECDIDAVFCANDVLAIGFMRAAMENNIKIPEKISVIGCDNIKFAKYCTPSLTTINIPKYELGRKSVKTLMTAINGENSSESDTIAECQLILRESS